MGLTSGAFLAVLIVLCVAATLATALLGNRIPGPRPPAAVLARIAMVAVCQLLAVAVVAAWINNAFGLYTSWSDLLGTSSGKAVFTGPGGGAAAGPPGPAPTFTRQADGVLLTRARGPQSGLSGRILVWTPPEYDQPAYRTTGFPVVMLLHGIPGSPQTWFTAGEMPQAVEGLLTQRRVRPFLLVAPVIDPGRVNTDCSDVGATRTATWLARDVPAIVGRSFRTLSGARGRALLGLSTGGFCAVKLPLQFPSVFATGAAMSPDPLDGDPAALPSAALRSANSPQQLVRRSHPPVALLLATTLQDRTSRPADLARFRQGARPPTRVSTLVLDTGGHNFGTWKRMYRTVLPWLSSHLAHGPGTP
ncbi:alpha/beta hydrolase [Streptacidiphilus griseoplanus]|uniref:alpha/beta hydrolase n=1 Tax=Peterkaempfera griseoplana TaxID=66896 RepID=UPI0006E37642|nr:alpha/beta hydrolase-fold protein [Peterkaempfera griseoplana]